MSKSLLNALLHLLSVYQNNRNTAHNRASWDNVVSIVIWLRGGYPKYWSIPSKDNRFISSQKCPDQLRGPTQPPTQWMLWVRWLGH